MALSKRLAREALWWASVLCSGLAVAAAPPSPVEPWSALQARAGHWVAHTAEGAEVTLDYRVVSRGTLVLEAWQQGKPSETLTVYHLDGRRLLATHYCAQGNQPRLALVEAGDGSQRFAFADATGMQDRGASHLHDLVFETSADGMLRRTETYRSGAGDEVSTLSFKRVDGH